MANTDSWDSFFQDDDNNLIKEDGWEDINSNDFEDVSETIQLDDDFDDVEIKISDDDTEIFEDEKDYLEDNDFEDNFEPERILKNKDKKPKKNPAIIVLAAILAVGLIAAAIILIVKAASCGSTTFRENSPSEVYELVNKYYTARIQQDTYTLNEVLDSKISIDSAELKSEASILEGYQDVKVYTTAGVDDGEYVVYVSFNVKFKNIETAAPGFVPGYVRVDVNGDLKFIPDGYISQYSEDIQDAVNKAGQSDTIVALVDEINQKYEDALNSDSALKEYVESKFGSSETEATETTKATETTAAATETTTAADNGELKGEDASTFTECDQIWYTNDDVRLREQPNTDATTGYTQLSKGTKLWVTAKGSQWAKAMDESTGKEGYVALRYLDMNKPE